MSLFGLFGLFRPRRLFRFAGKVAIASLILSLGAYMLGHNQTSSTETVPTTDSVTGYQITQTFSSLVSSAKEVIEENNDFSEASLEYSGSSSIDINNGIPFFKDSEIAIESYESYSSLDSLGRCSTAIACLSKDTMPAAGEERGEIGKIKPSGWHTIKYDCIEDRYLYNRCHLIGWQLGAENDNKLNLITGTRYMNLEMTDTENLVARYIKKTGHHVMYRVTPVYNEDELVCRGLLIEAKSVEDDEISICKYYFNVQPGIEINYETGESSYNGIFLDTKGQSVIAK